MDSFRLTNFLLLVATLISSATAFPCSYMQLGTAQNKVSAQNFDFFPNSLNSIVVNKRNMEKSAGVFENTPAGSTPAKWVSRFGSITFGFGLENPVTGVNEAGLTIYRFIFETAQYPASTPLPALKESLYVQYILDTAETLSEAIAQTKAVQIFAETAPTHFAICDRMAACAVIEAVNSKLNIYSGADIQIPALTNDDYPSLMSHYNKCPSADCGSLTNSEWRFASMAKQIRNFSGRDLKQGTFDILSSVKQTDGVFTIWTVLTDLSAGKNMFYLKNTKSSNVILALDFRKLDYSCKTPVQVALLDSESSAASVQLVDYNKQFQATITNTLGNLGVSPEEMKRLIDYPEMFTRCLN